MNAIIAGASIGVLIVIISLFLSRDRGRRRILVFYPAIVGLIGSTILLVVSFSMIGGWEGIGYAMFSVPILLISLLLLLVLTILRREA
ncbi:YesK family protein [Paenibacillus ihuae]|uniref:YesK family protein n=1 Tax=Paenibacillus ihuae TaxID=1232431 RepID=UPI0006D52B49|nr:YesK family protein [Paenibacillus ihuae]